MLNDWVVDKKKKKNRQRKKEKKKGKKIAPTKTVNRTRTEV